MNKYCTPCFSCKEPYRNVSKMQILRCIVAKYHAISHYSSATVDILYINSSPSHCRYGMHCSKLSNNVIEMGNTIISLKSILAYFLDTQNYDEYSKICKTLRMYDVVTSSKLLRLLSSAKVRDAQG